jgi:hypothetical protein
MNNINDLVDDVVFFEYLKNIIDLKISLKEKEIDLFKIYKNTKHIEYLKNIKNIVNCGLSFKKKEDLYEKLFSLKTEDLIAHLYMSFELIENEPILGITIYEKNKETLNSLLSDEEKSLIKFTII